MEKAKAGPPIRNPSQDTTNYRGAPTLRDLGISRDQSSRWQKLAAVPREEFEEALAEHSALFRQRSYRYGMYRSS
jgi:hypothetical protein